MPHCNVVEILQNLWRRSGNISSATKLGLPAQLPQIGRAGTHHGMRMREVSEDPIDPETEEFEIFKARIAAIVDSQIFFSFRKGLRGSGRWSLEHHCLCRILDRWWII